MYPGLDAVADGFPHAPVRVVDGPALRPVAGFIFWDWYESKILIILGDTGNAFGVKPTPQPEKVAVEFPEIRAPPPNTRLLVGQADMVLKHFAFAKVAFAAPAVPAFIAHIIGRTSPFQQTVEHPVPQSGVQFFGHTTKLLF